MNMTLLALILGTVTMSAVAQLTLKLGVGRPGFAEAAKNGVIDMIIAVLLNPMIMLGLTIYAGSVLVWLWVLSKVDLSIAYPFVGVSFIVTAGFGAFLLNEDVTPMRIFGTALIAVGCALVARTA